MVPVRGKILSAKEFRDLGLLQELNRLFLHPRGLAMAVTLDGDDVSLGPIYDWRADPEGGAFVRGELDPGKAAFVDRLFSERIRARLALPEIAANGVQKLDSEWEPEEDE